MFEPILHKFVIGTSAVIVAISTVRIADSIDGFLQATNERMKHVEHNTNRITESIERGMNKYAPPKK